MKTQYRIIKTGKGVIRITPINLHKVEQPDLEPYALKNELAVVATSGSYNDLSDKPSIRAVENSYLTINDLLSNQSNQTASNFQSVEDASSDPTVGSGYAYYEYLGDVNGVISDYRKLSEQESMDLVPITKVSQLENDRLREFVIQPNISKTIGISDLNKSIVNTSSLPTTNTIPTNANDPLPIGFELDVVSKGTGVVTISSTGVTIISDLQSMSLAIGETRTLLKTDVNTWSIKGKNPPSAAKQYQTAFVNPTTGNNTTAVLEDSSKPFASIDGVFARYTSNQPITSFVKIYLVNAGTYHWTQKIWGISFEIYSDKAVSVDLSNATFSGSIFHDTSTFGYTTYFNFPIGGFYQNAGSANFGHERRAAVVNIKSIYCNSGWGSFFSFDYGVTIQNLSEVSINTALFSNINICQTPISLSKFTALGSNAKILCKNGIFVNYVDMNGILVNNLFTHLETWDIGDVNGKILFSYSHNSTIKINFRNSNISGGFHFENENGNLTFSGIIASTTIYSPYGWNTRSDRRAVLNLINLSINDLKSNGFDLYDSFGVVNIINCYINQTVGSWFLKSVGRTSTAVTFKIKVEKTTFRQSTPATFLLLDNNNNLEPINIGGFESNCLSISNINATPINFDLLSFKDKKKEVVVRSKVDLIGRVLDSQTTYVIDGKLILLNNEFVEIPAGGLTLAGYGFNVSGISKNVAGQSIFSSPVGGSGDFITRDIVYDSGLGSVFNITDSTGFHAIEMNDVNFENCSSIGKIRNYRQFTGTTNGFYNCLDGIQLSGTWTGFKITNSNVLGFGSSGTFIKKDVDTVFSNRLYLDLNLSFATGAKLSDFNDTNFSGNELFQINNTLLKVNGVVDDSNTILVLPNIAANNPKSRWTNSIGLKLTAQKFQDLKSATKVWRLSVDDAGVISTVEI